MGKQNLALGIKVGQRMSLLGRMRMADWIEMPEAEFAREIERVEKDALFKKLFFGAGGLSPTIRRQRWPRGRLAGLFEMNEGALAGGERVRVEEMLRERAGITEKIKRLGQEAFERYFVHADEPLSLFEIAKRTAMSVKDVEQIHNFLLEMGAQAEFSGPAPKAGPVQAQVCLAHIEIEDGEPQFSFYSAHWARGLYQIRYDLLEDWKGKALEAGERKELPKLLKKLETINLRQSTLYRVMETLCRLQTEYLRSRKEESRRPVSLRQMARKLDLAPSTVSRALAGRSVRLPWGEEIRLIELLPGRRRMLRRIVGGWLADGLTGSDADFAERLKSEHGIRVSRRTVNAVRNELKKPS